MNKYNFNFRVVYTVFSLILLTTCEDFLKEVPKDRLTSANFFNNSEELGYAINGLLNHASAQFSQSTFVIPGCGSEQLCATNLHPEKLPFREFDRYNISGINKRMVYMWQVFYQLIRDCNWIYDKASQVQTTEGVKTLVKGQTQLLKAWAYFYLVRLWGYIPVNNQYDGLLDGVYMGSPEQVYALINEYLDEAEAALPMNWTESDITTLYGSETWQDLPSFWKGEGDRATLTGHGNRALPTLGWAKSLRANVYLNMAGWPLKQTDKYALSAQVAKEVIDNAVTYGYGLMEDYQELWLFDKDFNKEEIIIFGFDRDGNSNIVGTGLKPWDEYESTWANGWGDCGVEAQFFLKFPESYRKKVSIISSWYLPKDFNKTTNTPRFNPANYVSWENSAAKMPWIAKWRNYEDFPYDSTYASVLASNSRAIHALRYAHVLLAYAEAKTMSDGPDALAYECVNQIRRRAYKLPLNVPSAYDLQAGLSAEQFRDSVVQERNYEFIGEMENRWYDLQRLEMIEKIAEDIQAWRNENSGYINPQIGNITRIPTKEDGYWLPYPSTEVDRAPDLFGPYIK